MACNTHGAAQFVKDELVENDDKQAWVTIVLDASGVAVASEDEGTFVGDTEAIVTHISLERTGNWRMLSTTARIDRNTARSGQTAITEHRP